MESNKKMRIISGELKGRTISFLKIQYTASKDSVRENIFNILNHSNLININLKKSKILDLYSGIGSFALKAFLEEQEKFLLLKKI